MAAQATKAGASVAELSRDSRSSSYDHADAGFFGAEVREQRERRARPTPFFLRIPPRPARGGVGLRRPSG